MEQSPRGEDGSKQILPSSIQEDEVIAEESTRNDLIAGWLGGAVGILVSNPLEVLKVRLQTTRVPSSRVGAGSRTSNPSSNIIPTASTSSLSTSTSSSSKSSSSKPIIIPSTIPPSHSFHSNHQHQHQIPSSRPGLQSLWKAEGLKFLFAGAAGPILGLAFIDSCFFGGYGIAMQQLGQDRQDPSQLSRVFLAGAASGASCALLQTPIEVVKCRAQAERSPSSSSTHPGKKLGSFKIAQLIAKKEGLRGFYTGGLMTACRDGISSGVFFWGYFVFRRMLRGQEPFQSSSIASSHSSSSSIDSPSSTIDQPRAFEGGKINKMEVGRILLAGGLAGSLSAVVPYPFDIIKTRLQTANVESRAYPLPPSASASSIISTTHSTPFHFSSPLPSTTNSLLAHPPPNTPLTVRLVASGIHQDGMSAFRYRYSSSFLYSFLSNSVFKASGNKEWNIIDGVRVKGVNQRAADWSIRLLGLKGFLRGIKPTVVSSFVGSAATITTFEIALVLLGGESGGGGIE